jgi:Raf kinase inhibitor-like YbhB/YbcL family protein
MPRVFVVTLFVPFALASVLAFASSLVGCPKNDSGGAPKPSTSSDPGGDVGVTFQVTSADFTAGATIPTQLTCDGANVSPTLAWTDTGATTKGYALIVDDPDAPSGTFTHWVLFDVPQGTTSLAQSSSGVGIAGDNDFGDAKYGGPCPPKGKGAHHYFFRVFALDVAKLGPSQGASRADVEAAMKGHVLAKGELMGTFGH